MQTKHKNAYACQQHSFKDGKIEDFKHNCFDYRNFYFFLYIEEFVCSTKDYYKDLFRILLFTSTTFWNFPEK